MIRFPLTYPLPHENALSYSPIFMFLLFLYQAPFFEFELAPRGAENSTKYVSLGHVYLVSVGSGSVIRSNVWCGFDSGEDAEVTGVPQRKRLSFRLKKTTKLSSPTLHEPRLRMQEQNPRQLCDRTD